MDTPAPPDRGLSSRNLRRSVLDPIVRQQAIETPGVDYLPGLTAVGLEGDERSKASASRGTVTRRDS